LEIGQKKHKKKLSVLEKNERSILIGLDKINNTMMKTKTAVYTGVGVLIVQKFGLFETIKMLIL